MSQIAEKLKKDRKNLLSLPKPPSDTASAQDRSVKQKWGERLGKVNRWRRDGTGYGGYVPVVRSFLRLYSKLDMAPTLAMLVLHIVDSKWDASHPRMSSKVLATRLGLSAQQVKRHLHKLREYGVQWTYDGTTRVYTFDMEPFFEKVAALAEEARDQRLEKLEEMRTAFEEGAS